MIDVTQQISAVERTVGSRVLPAGEARILTLTRSYRSAVDDVWDACTTAERIGRWFLPVTGELRVDGRYQIESNASGTVTACAPPRSFAATWEYGSEVSWIEVRLTPTEDDGTLLVLEHTAHVDDERWAQYGPGAVGVGWDGALMGLAVHLSTGAANDPEQIAAWAASAEGRRFYSDSSAAWCGASIAAGTDPVAARAAADRTTEFYTTVPEGAGG